MLELHAHRSNPPSEHQVHLTYEVGENAVIVDFEVICPSLNLAEHFNIENWDNWGLWEHDVVEVFIQKKSSSNHYLELQISPLGQKFALLVKSPRKDFQKLTTLNTDAQAIKTDRGFRAQFNIDISEIPGEGSDLFANFHACLGPEKNRCYFSHIVNEELTPDYHRPDLFDRIGVIHG